MANLSNINNKFLVTTGGNVLIGQTADDGNRLQIDGDAIIKNGTYGKILLRNSSNYLYGDANGVLIAAASDNLRLYTAGTQRLRIDSSGNVLLLSNTASFKLGATSQTYLLQSSSHFFLDNTSGTSYFRNTSATGSGFIFRNSNIGDIQFDNEFAGNILFNTSNVTRLTIDSSGKSTFAGMITVNGGGIDIDNNDDIRIRFDNASVFKAGLQVATTAGDMIGDSAINDFAIRSQENMLFATGGNTERMRIDSSGNVGIGITDPSAKLEVKESLYVSHPNAEEITFRLNNYGATGTDAGPLLRMFNQLGTTVINIDSRGGSSRDTYFNQGGNFGIGTTSPETDLMIYDTVNEDPAEPGFATTGMFALNRSGQATLSMGVGANNSFWMSNVNRAFTGPNYYNISLNPLGGRVGIGTTSPSTELQVESTNPIITLQRNNNGNAGGAVQFRGSDSVVDWQMGTNQVVGLGLEFNFQNSNKVYIETGGNVGIGVTGPIAQLDVAGNTNQHHSVSTNNNGSWRSIQNLGVTSWLDQTYSAGRLKVFGYENGNVNVSYCEYYVIRSSTGYYIQQIGTRLDVGNTHGQVECRVSGNFLQIRNVAQSSLGIVRVVFSGMKN